jgi:heterodisulfide reductase subunit C2
VNTKTMQLSAGQNTDFAAVVAQASGGDALVCLQCTKCSCGCPVSARADLKPHELVRLVQLGARDEILASRMLWECTSCETCVTRCPQQVDIPAIVDALRALARASGTVPDGVTVPAFNDIFLKKVEKLGRMHEISLMVSYKLRTGDLFSDAGKFPMMLRKGKLPLLPKSVKGGGERKRLFERARQAAAAAGGKKP